MVINYKDKSKIKILIDTEDLKNADISMQDWLISPKKNLNKLFSNFPEYEKIDIKTTKNFNIYSFKFILFYIIIEF